MASALVGALRVSLSAETSAFEAGMKRSQRQAAQTASSIKGSFNSLKGALGAGVAGFIGGIGISSLLQAGKAALDYASHLGELADTLGLTTKDLQTFSYVAAQVGVSQEQLETGIQKLTLTLGQLKLGAEAPRKAFDALGKGFADQVAAAPNTGAAFRLIAEKLETVSDRSKRAAFEMAAMGKSGAKLDNLLSGSQGRLSELSAAYEKLGIALSDEQIQKADATADKVAALQTVLKQQIAGVVADNSDAILGFADALVKLVGGLGTAVRAYRAFVAEMTVLSGKIDAFDPTNSAQNKANARLRIAQGQVELMDLRMQQAGKGTAAERAARFKAAIGAGPAPAKPTGSGSIGQFLGGGGPKPKRAREDHTAEKLAREQYELQRQELDAQRTILEAKRDLSSDYVEQTTLAVQILDNERDQYKAELDYEITQKKISKAQAEHFLAEYDIADSLKRQKLIQEEAEQRQRDTQMLVQHDFDRRADILKSQEDIATTQSERRKIELELLQLAYEQKRQALQNILDTSKDEAAIEDARRDLINLKATYANDRQGVMQRTAGPLENYLNSIPHTADQVNEALQNLEVQGIEGLADALSHVGEGWKSMRDIALSTIRDIVSALIKMQVQRMFFSLLSAGSGGFGGGLGGAMSLSGSLGGGASVLGSVPLSGAFGSLPGFAGGGSFNVMGRTGIDKNILSLNGLPVARVNYGERVTVGNDNVPRGGGHTFNVNVTAPDTGNRSRDRATALQQADAIRAAVSKSSRVHS
jgi:hypothetical protein